MAKRVHMILSDRQYDFLLNERARTGLPIGELVRRAIDTTYRPTVRPP